MANGIVNGLENVLGLDTNAGTAELQQAIAALQAVGVPNAAQLTLPELQKYVQAGVLSPTQYQAISENPQAYQDAFNAAQDTTGQTAQKAALQQLGNIVQAGGSTPINQANLLNNINTTNQAMQGARQGIEENARERGVAGGGLEYINKLMNEQANASNANTGAVNAASNNAQLALQALANQGNLSGTLQGQANQTAEAKAQAANQIAQYNSQLQSMANQYNTQNANTTQAQNLANAQNISNQNVGNANYRTQYNAQVPETVFQNQMSKAGGLANAYGNMANLKENQAAGQNQFVGGLLGAGATLGGDYMMGQAAGKAANQIAQNNLPKDYDPYTYPQYAEGGEVDEREFLDPVPGPESYLGAYRGHDGKLHLDQVRTAAMGGEICYAQGGEVHDHAICMKVGGGVPGTPNVPGDSTANDTVPAMLSPHEIVLPRSVSTAPDAPQKAAQFVGQVKGQPTPMGNGKSFADVIRELEADGLELRLCAKDY